MRYYHPSHERTETCNPVARQRDAHQHDDEDQRGDARDDGDEFVRLCLVFRCFVRVRRGLSIKMDEFAAGAAVDPMAYAHACMHAAACMGRDPYTHNLGSKTNNISTP